MQLKTRDHEEIMAFFERLYSPRCPLMREPKAQWPHGYIYANGQMNELFLAFRHGVAYGRATNE
jgi:hypothetical protein